MPLADKNVPETQDEPDRSTAGGPRMISVAGHRIDSRDLFIGTREVLIHHGGEQYRLRLTAQNRLILTK
jgi:hemin uptake protein HemP